MQSCIYTLRMGMVIDFTNTTGGGLFRFWKRRESDFDQATSLTILAFASFSSSVSPPDKENLLKNTIHFLVLQNHHTIYRNMLRFTIKRRILGRMHREDCTDYPVNSLDQLYIEEIFFLVLLSVISLVHVFRSGGLKNQEVITKKKLLS